MPSKILVHAFDVAEPEESVLFEVPPVVTGNGFGEHDGGHYRRPLAAAS
ncbi:MAG TPA: hypothetical protein VK988_20020 [Acidimicrobiales bacterium]|nr:hypothetical protein [Acidimicrobiales bacterium]